MKLFPYLSLGEEPDGGLAIITYIEYIDPTLAVILSDILTEVKVR